MSPQSQIHLNATAKSAASRQFWVAIIANSFWINLSEIWRYLAVVKPMLHDAMPDRFDIAPFTLPVFGLWAIWDCWLIVSATGFYWLYLNWAGKNIVHAMIASAIFTATVFGLLWFAIANMGLLPMSFFWNAVPLAWLEQAIAAAIVMWALRRDAG